MSQSEPSILELTQAVQAQMRIDFEKKTAQIPHSGQKGVAREEVLRRFLADYLPKRFAVSAGFVVDAARKVSKQVDAIIYDQLSAPVFHVIEGQRLFPAESVAGAIAVKSTLRRKDLSDAIDNLASVAVLDRFASGRPEIVFGGVPSPFEHSAFHGKPPEPIFTAAFAYDSPALKTVALNLHDLNLNLAPRSRLQLIAVLNRGVVTYIDGTIIEPTYSPTARVAFVEDPKLALPLFYAFLTNHVMRKMPLLISIRNYLGLQAVQARWIE